MIRFINFVSGNYFSFLSVSNTFSFISNTFLSISNVFPLVSNAFSFVSNVFPLISNVFSFVSNVFPLVSNAFSFVFNTFSPVLFLFVHSWLNILWVMITFHYLFKSVKVEISSRSIFGQTEYNKDREL